MPEVSPEDLNPVANKQEAQGLWADGKRMFALNEMDEKVTPITSKAMLDSYSADAIGWMEPAQAPAPSQRFMPEGVDEDKFYSQLNRVITDKVPTRATAAQIMATIDPTRGSGVKADEIKWSGIEQALQSLEKDGKVSKEDLLNYLRNEGRVRFEEVVAGESVEKSRMEQANADRAELANLRTELWSRSLTQGQLDMIADEAKEEGNVSTYMNLLSKRYPDDSEKIKRFASLSRLVDVHDRTTPASTRYAQYQLPGGENYREVVLAMPQQQVLPAEHSFDEKINNGNSRWFIKNAEGKSVAVGNSQAEALSDYYTKYPKSASEYTSSHFPNIPNYVAHMRTNERVDADGRPGLFVEEFQSDRHQEGRKKGYKNTLAVIKEQRKDGTWHVELENGDMKNFYNERDADRYIEDASYNKIADAPFRTTWPLQLFKRALRDAVDSGKEWVGWTTGETQAERFDLSKQIGKVVWNEDTKMLTAYDPSQQRTVIQESNITADKLEDYIGKEVAKKLVDQSPDEDMDRSLAGLDLRVGGEGMKGFYDTMLPKEIGKYVKPFGGKVEKSEVATPSPTKRTDDLTDAELLQELNRKGDTVPIWKVSITPEMRQLAQGQMRFMPESYRGEHTAPTTESAPASDLTSNGVYPADVYTRPDWYEQDDGLEEMRKIQRLKGKPDGPVWIHRAVPLDVAEEAMKSDTPLRYVFRGGDWVTTSKQYAKDHGESALNGKYRVFSKRVKAKDIYTNGDSIFEWGYNPEETEKTTKKSTAKGNSSAIANAAKLK